MENNKDKNLDYAELTKYFFIAFHTYSLDMKEIHLLEYKITPKYKCIGKEYIKKILNIYLQSLNLMII